MIPVNVRILSKQVDYPSVLARQEQIMKRLVDKTKQVTQLHFAASKKAVAEKSSQKPQMLPVHDSETPVEILVVEHYPGAYTMGKRDTTVEGLRFPNAKTETEKEEQARKFRENLFHLKRGGGLTYHGPGQVTVYPILHIPTFFKFAPAETKAPKQGALHWYTEILEKTMMGTLEKGFNVKNTFPANTGVWVPHPLNSDSSSSFTAPTSRTEAPANASKIGFIGLDFRQNCVMHGMALNLTKESLVPFDNIVICEMEKAETTCLEQCCSISNLDYKDVGLKLVDRFAELTDLKNQGFEVKVHHE